MGYLIRKHIGCICIAALTLAVCAPVPAQEPEPVATDADSIVMKSGRRVSCTVRSIDQEGVVRFTGAWVRGDVRADLNGVQRFLFKPTDTRLGKDVVMITNGDIIDGEVVEITAENVTIDSEMFLGEVDIPLRVVERIAFGSAGRYIGMTGLAGGDSRRWQPMKGKWWFADDRIYCLGAGPYSTIALPLKHEGSVTVVLKAVSPAARNVPWVVDLLARNVAEVREAGRVRVHFGLAIARADNRRNPQGRLRVFPKGQKGPCAAEFRVAYDAETQTVSVWVNNIQISKGKTKNIVPAATHILLSARSPGYIEQVRVYAGVVPPGKEETGKGEKDKHVLVMLNGSRGKCTGFTLEDERYMMQVRGEELPLPADRVKHVITAADGRTRPAIRKGDVRVVAGRRRVTLQVTGLKDGRLTGQCEYLGNVRIAREAIERIEAISRIEAVQIAPKADIAEGEE